MIAEIVARPHNRHCADELRDAFESLEYRIEHLVTRVDELTLKRLLRKLVDEAEEHYSDYLSRPQA